MNEHSRNGQKTALVIGAGPGGLTAAIALDQIGYNVCVFERASPAENGSGLTLWPNAMRALDHLGMGRAVSSISQRTDTLAMRTWNGKELFSLSEKTQPAAAAVQGFALLRSELINSLSTRLKKESIRFGKRCVGYRQERDSVVAVFDEGLEEAGDVLVACDGINSQLRGRMLGPVALKYSGYTVWRGIAPYQLSNRAALTSVGSGMQFGIFPLLHNRVYWFASAVVPRDSCDWKMGRKQELLQRFRQWHKPITDLIEATEPSQIIRTDIYDHEPFNHWVDGRVALLGDAAHPSTPTLGQGACQAIEDAVVLAASLSEAAEVTAALAFYESRRHQRTASITLQSRRFGQMGCWTNSVACWVRNRLIKTIPESLRLHQLNKMLSFDCAPVAAHTYTRSSIQ